MTIPMLLWLAVVSLSLFSVASSASYYEVKGNSYEVGYALGSLMNETILKIYELKKKTYAKHLTEWETMAQNTISQSGIPECAPVSFLEMTGMADAPGLSMKIVSMLNVEYEMEMYAGMAHRCTGFAASGPAGLIGAQTNDENPAAFLGMEGLCVQKRNDASLVFTHHGMLTYMGMSRHGMVALWQYVDNGEYDFDSNFVPATIILREALEFDTLRSLESWLRSVPRAVAENFIFLKSGEGILDVELSPTNYTSVFVPVSPAGRLADICHANNFVFSQGMADNDLGVDPTSPHRYDKCRELMKKYRATGEGITAERAKDVLESPPIHRDGKWEDTLSVASMVFLPDEKTMFIRFFEESVFREYKL